MVKVLIINKPEMVLKDDTYTHMYIKRLLLDSGSIYPLINWVTELFSVLGIRNLTVNLNSICSPKAKILIL